VLVIDDAKLIQRFAETFFSRLKFEVIVASDGYEGVKLALARKPDLILIDIMMPRLDGLKAMQLIKANHNVREVPIIVMTAYSDRINVVSAAKLGAAAVITKPLTEEILFTKLKSVFGEEFVQSMIPTDPKEKENPFGVNEQEFSDAVSAMVEEFLKFYAEQIGLLETAVRNRDVESIRRVTHNIRGTSGSFGYNEATRLATELNEVVHASTIDWHAAEVLLVQLKNRLTEMKVLVADDIPMIRKLVEYHLKQNWFSTSRTLLTASRR